MVARHPLRTQQEQEEQLYLLAAVGSVSEEKNKTKEKRYCREGLTL
jgi:hypothetical protein